MKKPGYILAIYCMSVLMLFTSGVKAGVFYGRFNDTSITATIKGQLQLDHKGLHYPLTVERFYKRNGFKLATIGPDTLKTQAGEAMLLLDCSVQYGLSHADYHPNELLYETLKKITTQFDKVSNKEKARFDILLTDALITFMNNLHFGKLNPYYTTNEIDKGNINGFNAEGVLIDALRQANLKTVLLSVQPKSKEYKDLQYHMHLLTGQYQADCYEIPESNIRKVAINMERLRWAGIEKGAYIHVNIPSYTLMFHLPDTTYLFKAIVGKPSTPTPVLQNDLSYFTIAPDKKTSQNIADKELALKIANTSHTIVFSFAGPSTITLYGTNQQQQFKQAQRDISQGNVQIDKAEMLAALLLKNDGTLSKVQQMKRGLAGNQTQRFALKRTIPVKITYLTCNVYEGELVTYKDIYNLDNRLEMALYK